MITPKYQERLFRAFALQPFMWVGFFGSELMVPCDRRIDVHWYPAVFIGLLLFTIVWNLSALFIVDCYRGNK